MIALVTGPVRSGKSHHALALARSLGVPVVYVATARVDPDDPEMRARIERHRRDRGEMAVVELWRPGVGDLPAVIASAEAPATLLVDSLGTWLGGHLLELEALAETDANAALRELEARTAPLEGALAATPANVVLVAEETGWGLVPPSPLGRIFRDHLGRLTARLARAADRADLVVAGFALDLKRLGAPVGPPD